MLSSSYLCLLLLGALLIPAHGRFMDSDENFEDEIELHDIGDLFDNTCCVREKKQKKIGVTAGTLEDIIVDLGRCRKHCGRESQHLKKKEFERLMQDYPDLNPMELFQLHSGQPRGRPSCPDSSTCTASESREEQILTSEGIVHVNIIEECNCKPKPNACQRQSKFVTMHKGTPLETTIDVGECQGRCTRDLGCKATRTKTVAVEGPNGSECASVIETCGCEDSCYRASFYEQVYNYTVDGQPSVEVIDVGTCVGECDTTPENHCVLRDDSGCRMSLVKRTSSCSPSGINHINVRQKNGLTRTISSITHCGCH
ncbi:unnamed protein product [Meganyctiphanes norvegica]|uniref:Uncharacterized protein n=1 Tax=Meganyctiphanes norvegica TaxID=48144 RepID=A0AAV2RAW8_MEGNR